MVKPLYESPEPSKLELLTDNPIVAAIGAMMFSTLVALVYMVVFSNPWILAILGIPLLCLFSTGF